MPASVQTVACKKLLTKATADCGKDQLVVAVLTRIYLNPQDLCVLDRGRCRADWLAHEPADLEHG